MKDLERLTAAIYNRIRSDPSSLTKIMEAISAAKKENEK